MSVGNTASRQQTPSRGHQPGAVVIGGNYIALGVVRSLGRLGILVWVLHDRLHIDAPVSRYARRRLPWPADEVARLALLHELPAQHGLDGWALYPTDDEAAALVARNHRTLSEHFVLTTPPWDVLRWAYDKRLTPALALRLRIAHPSTHFPRDEAAVAALECAFPVILKPATKNLTRVRDLHPRRSPPGLRPTVVSLAVVAARRQGLDRASP